MRMLTNLAVFFAALFAIGFARWALARSRRGTPAPEDDLAAIKAALAAEGGRVVRANRDRGGHLVDRNEYLDENTGARLYHVTLKVGAVNVRRRVAVRTGHPAVILP